MDVIKRIRRSGGIVALSGKQKVFSKFVSNWTSPDYWDEVQEVGFTRGNEEILFRSAPLKNVVDVVPHIVALKTLRRINFDNTRIDSKSLVMLNRLESIEELSLAGTTLGRSEFSAIADLETLTHVNLYHAKFDENHLDSMANTRLQSLSLSMTATTNIGTKHLSKLTFLKNLDLSATKISDNGIRELVKLAQLEELNLCDSNVTDMCIEHLIRMKNLKKLDVCNTAITDQALDPLRKANPELDIESGFVLISWQ